MFVVVFVTVVFIAIAYLNNCSASLVQVASHSSILKNTFFAPQRSSIGHFHAQRELHPRVHLLKNAKERAKILLQEQQKCVTILKYRNGLVQFSYMKFIQ